MIATALIFLLGALVATLLALLFIPLLWRNAQRLARRDFAATMPVTSNEIRAEVDRVRAEAAILVRRNEMLAQKAREKLAHERAAAGRLTAEHARLNFTAEQRDAETQGLRDQLASLQSRFDGLEEDNARLDAENQELRETLIEAEAELRAVEEGERAQPSPSLDDAGLAADADARSTRSLDQETSRVTAATNALLALAREQRRERADTGAAGAAMRKEEPLDRPERERAASDAVISKLREAAASRPADPVERARQNGVLREQIADFAARLIHATLNRSGRTLPRTDDGTADPNAPDLAERVRRLGEGPAAPDAAPAAVNEDSDLLLAQTVSPASAVKGKRGGGRSRRRSRR